MDAALLMVYNELEREDEHEMSIRQRNVQRQLRDNSDPFSMPNRKFKPLFRFPKEVALELIGIIELHLQASTRNTAVPAFLKVLAALHFYGKGSYQTCIGQNFCLGLSQCSVSRAINEVTRVINGHLLQECIKFPDENQTINEIKQSFLEKFDLPGTIGVVDGTLITIVTPPINDPVHPAHLFIDRKGHHSINAQIICDADLRILSINARYPGSVHDAAIWMMSRVKQHLEDTYNRNRRSIWLIGDSGFPNQPWLLTPVLQAHAGSPEDRYNTRLRSARNCIERCIGVLKARFRCLLKDRVLHYSPPMAGSIINACAVLHNFLINRNVQWEEPIYEDDEDQNDGNRADGEQQRNVMLEGQNVRARVIRQYFA